MKLNWAERWVVNNPLRVFMERLEIAWMEKAACDNKPRRVLEVGAGRGAAARLIISRFRPETLVTTDLDPAMLARGRAYLSREELEQANMCAADCVSLPFRDEALDAVFGFGVLHHVAQWYLALAEISRVLRPGGAYFLEELYPSLYQNILTKHILLHPAANRFRSADFKISLSTAGLRIEALREIKLVGIVAMLTKSVPRDRRLP